ncbi:MAG: hypothetical protein NTX71_03540 [Candidatus Aureabacteria bacterium]|nr:hypothetical protein [Candidatus Auribacterota bacterium]
MSKKKNNHMPPKKPKPDPPTDEKCSVPPDMDGKSKPVDPKPPEENEEGDVGTSSPPDSEFFPEIDHGEDELTKFLISIGWL